jgi:hypothetical protein
MKVIKDFVTRSVTSVNSHTLLLARLDIKACISITVGSSVKVMYEESQIKRKERLTSAVIV